MADEKDPALSPEVLDTTVDPQTGASSLAETTPEAKAPEASGNAPEGAADAAIQEDQYELVVGGAEAASQQQKDEASWARTRKELADKTVRIAELERQLQAGAGRPATVPDPGPEPTEEDCEYDFAEYRKRYAAWTDAKAKKQIHDAEVAKTTTVREQEWQGHLSKYGRTKEELAKQLPSYPELESVVARVLSPDQQDAIILVAENPAKVVAALGLDPKKAQDFANTANLALFSAKVAKLEGQVTVKKKTQTPPPEKKVVGSGPPSGTVDPVLARLRKEAQETGDLSKVSTYLREQKAKQGGR
jgi:hypothetical protein